MFTRPAIRSPRRSDPRRLLISAALASTYVSGLLEQKMSPASEMAQRLVDLLDDENQAHFDPEVAQLWLLEVVDKLPVVADRYESGGQAL